MKIFRKILAVALCAILILSLFPFSVFADTPPSASPSVVQGEKGTGADGTLTITLNLSAFSDWLQAIESAGGLAALPDGAVTYDQEILTVDEMLAFINVEDFLKLILGDNYEELPQLLENLSDGDMKNLMDLIDSLEDLIASADFDALAEFVSEIDGIEDVLKIDALRLYFAEKPLSEVIELFGSGYTDFINTLAVKLNNQELTQNDGETPLAIGDLVDFDSIDPNDFSDAMYANAAKLYDALADMIAAGLTIPACYDVKETTLYTNDIIKSGVIDLLKDNANTQILTSAGIGVAIDRIVSQIDLSNYISEASLTALFNDYPEIVGTLIGFIAADANLTTEGEAALYNLRVDQGRDPYDTEFTEDDLDLICGNPAYYELTAEIEGTPFLTEAGKTAFVRLLLSSGGAMSSDEVKSYLNSTYCDLSLILAKTVDIVLELGLETEVTAYLNNDFLSDAADLFSAEDIEEIFGTTVNYNVWNLFCEILNLINENELNLDQFVEVDLSVLLADDEIVSFFKDHVTEWFTPSEIIDIIGDQLTGYLKNDFYSHTSLIRFAKDYVDVGATLRKILNDNRRLEDFVDLDALLDLDVDYAALFGLFDTAEIVEQLKDDIPEVFAALTAEQRKSAIIYIVTSILEQFQKVTVDGYTVASHNGRVLAIDPDALMYAVWEILPKFDELASPDFDGTLLSFNTTFDYQNADGSAVHKDVNVIVRTESGIETIRRVAALLNRYVSVTLAENNRFEIEINTPALLADLYRKALSYNGESEAINSLRQKLLAMEGMTGKDLVDAFADIPLSEIVAALDDVDVNAVYESLVNRGYIQRVLDKLEELSGIQYSLSDFDTLDDLLELIRRDDLSSIETLVGRISEKLNVDLMEKLETVAAIADENEYVQALLEKAASLPTVGKYVEGISAVEILETYRGMDPVRAVASFISDRVGRDVLARIYGDETAEELYHAALESIDARFSDLYERFQAFVVNLCDPNYEPTNESIQLLYSMIPEKLRSAFLNHSLLEIYSGNSLFSLDTNEIDFSFDRISGALVRRLGRIFSLDEDTQTTLLGFLPSGMFTFDLSVRFTFTNVYKVTFCDENGDVLLTTFLPKDVNPMVVNVPAREGKVVTGWATAPTGGSIVNAISGDMTLYASYEDEIHNVKFRFYDSLTDTYTETEIPVVWGRTISADAIPDQVPAGIDGDDCHRIYHRGDSIDGAVIPLSEIADTTVTEDGLVFTVAYYPIVRVNVIFKAFNGTGYDDLGAIAVEVNTCFTEDQIPVFEKPDDVADGCSLVYFAGDAVDLSKIVADPTAIPVTEETVYTLAYLPVGLIDGGDALVYLTTDADGNWTATVIGETDFDLTFDATDPAFASASSLTVQSDTVTMAIDSALLATIQAQTPLYNLRLSAKKSPNAKTFTVSSGIYRATSNEVYDLELLLNVDDADPTSGTRLDSFDGGLAVTIKPAEENLTVLASGNQTQRTAVYIANGESVTDDDLSVTTSVANKSVTFYPPHFTEIIIVNEYLLTPEFVGTVSVGTFLLNGVVIPAEGVWIPEGATLIKPSARVADANARVSAIAIDGADVERGDDFSPMPKKAVTATVTTVPAVFEARYAMPDGTLYTDKADAEAWLDAHPDAVPLGYEFAKDETGNYVFTNASIDPAVAKVDVYRTPVLSPVTYAIVFRPGHGANDILSTFTILNAQNGDFIAPALPAIAGYTAVRWSDYDLNAIIANSQSNTVDGIYAAQLFTVTYPNGSVAAFQAGDEVNALFGYALPAGYEIESVSCLAADGTLTTLPKDVFVFEMPCGNVDVIVSVRPVTLTVKVNGKSVQAEFGSIYTFDVTLAENEFLAEEPDALLIASRTDAKGSRVLTYAADVIPGLNLSYRVEKRQAAQIALTDGVIDIEVDPNAIYESSSDTSFPSAVYSFEAQETQERAPIRLLWLWILIIVILVIAIIALLYMIITLGDIGPNLFTRPIVALGNLFLAICRAIRKPFVRKK